MNPLNYASLEASKRLAEAGIVLETEALYVDLCWSVAGRLAGRFLKCRLDK